MVKSPFSPEAHHRAIEVVPKGACRRTDDEPKQDSCSSQIPSRVVVLGPATASLSFTWRAWSSSAARRIGTRAVQALLTSVRTGSVSERTRTGVGGHRRSPTVQRNRRSPGLQLTQLRWCGRAIRIMVPKLGVRRYSVEASPGLPQASLGWSWTTGRRCLARIRSGRLVRDRHRSMSSPRRTRRVPPWHVCHWRGLSWPRGRCSLVPTFF